MESHYRASAYAEVMIGGINAEVAPAQWEFQVAPASGTFGADDLLMARYMWESHSIPSLSSAAGSSFFGRTVSKERGLLGLLA